MEEEAGSVIETVADEVVETIESIDYTPLLESIEEKLGNIELLLESNYDFFTTISEYQKYISGFLLFGVVVVLFYFTYKFFRMFF